MADKISVLYSEEEVNARIRELGEQISKDYIRRSDQNDNGRRYHHTRWFPVAF